MLEEEFDKYANKYDLTSEGLKSRYNHCYRVMNLSEKYAKMLGFDKEDIKLAKTIGLLHDLGRFEQYRLFNSFNDLDTIDHAHYSVIELFDKNKIEKFYDKKEDYEIIKFAIENHNKIKIPKCNNERMLKHAKLIRDVDKIDIMFLLGVLGEFHSKTTDDVISKKVMQEIKNYTLVNNEDIKNNNDALATHFAYIFDINYNICLNQMEEYLKVFYKQIKGNKEFKKILDICDKYVKERMIEC